MSKPIISIRPSRFRRTYKVRRDRRYSKLIDAGLLNFEARPLSQIANWRMHPALRLLIKERKVRRDRIIREANRKGWSYSEMMSIYRTRIIKLYKKNHWVDKAGKYRGVPQPFELYRHYERIAPTAQYESPWTKRRSGKHKKIDPNLVADLRARLKTKNKSRYRR